MGNKTPRKFILIFLAIAGMSFLGIRNAGFKGLLQAHAEHQESQIMPEEKALEDKVFVFYLHWNYRCPLCLQIEEWSYDAIRESFNPKLQEGKLIWKTINVDKPENGHFTDEYQLSTQSLILVEMTGEKQKRFKKLEKIWEYSDDQQAFYDYVIQEINKFLNGN